jgi:dihydroorotate dehydrogenase
MTKLIYSHVLRPILFRMDPENAHHFAMSWLSWISNSSLLLRGLGAFHRVRKPRDVAGMTFPNAVGLAAGFDKDAKVLPAWEALGFGFVEVGTITAKAQPGNPRPRIFRIPEAGALINRMGFNNDGAEKVAARLADVKASGRWPKIPVGINIGKSKVTPVEEAASDYVASFRLLRPFADYMTLNVSSPNTPGLRSLQAVGELEKLLEAVMAENRDNPVPVFVKLAPDLHQEEARDIVAMGDSKGVAGWIATNTTVDHSSIPEAKRTTGGLSGAPLRSRATEWIRALRKCTDKPLIASGGVMNVEAAREKIDAGASLVQVYTGYVYGGPALVREIARAL